jgi:CRP-like cAMP-binding protein
VRQAPPEDVLAFLRANPDITLNLLSRIYRGTDGILQRILHLMGGDALSRLQFELLNSAYRFGETLTDGTVRLVMTEGDLAKRSGLARETVSRNLQDMKNRGIVTVTQGNIILKDVHWLEGQVDTGV